MLAHDAVIKNVYLDTYGQAPLTCPTCERTKHANLAPHKDRHIPLKIKCPCGAIFAIIVDTRKYYRKGTQLPGKFIKLHSEIAGSMVVENVSATGLGFRTKLKYDLHEGDMLEVCFTLDKGQCAEICRTVTVKHTDDYYVGVEYVHTRDVDADLGHYLLPD